jgi:hypothetical protein
VEVRLRVHVFEGVKKPELLLENVTVLMGVVGVADVSVTVAVH